MRNILLSALALLLSFNSFAVLGPIMGLNSLCGGNANIYTNATAGGVWSVTAGGASSINPTTGLFTAVTAGDPIIWYTVTNDCGSAVDSQTIHVRTAVQCMAETEELTGVSGAELKLFPNPSNGTFNVMLASVIDEEVMVTVTNVAGQKVNELATATNKETAMQMNVPAGIYFISARTTDGRYYTAKMVVTE